MRQQERAALTNEKQVRCKPVTISVVNLLEMITVTITFTHTAVLVIIWISSDTDTHTDTDFDIYTDTAMMLILLLTLILTLALTLLQSSTQDLSDQLRAALSQLQETQNLLTKEQDVKGKIQEALEAAEAEKGDLQEKLQVRWRYSF